MNNTDEERLRNDSSDDRQDRTMLDRAVTESRELSDEDRIEAYRMQSFQHVLPDIPPIPGYHTCWISTTSQNDTVLARMRMGYEPVTRADIPGWDFDKSSLKTGEYAGFIGINEMLAFKIKDSLYQAYMKIAHHDKPNQQDAKLVQDVGEIQARAKSQKTYVQSFDGADDIESNLRKQPRFD